MDKGIINKVFEEILSKHLVETKCSKKDLTREDKEFIEAFINSEEEWLDDDENEEDIAWQKYEDIQANHHYTGKEANAIVYWGHDGYKYINGKIYNTDFYQRFKEEGTVNESKLDKVTKDLNSAIDNGVRVPFDVVSHRNGHWDEGLKPGDVVVSKGFASTGLDGGLMLREDNYEITYYIPTGTRGVLLTTNQFDVIPGEQELLLGTGLRQYVLNQDDYSMTVEVLVLPDR